MSDYKALYRKWRPFDFDDVCGQKGITDILKYEVANDKISHAYLFCGSRGTGKTSCAKILAKAVNCLDSKDGNPCNKCEACLSIDAGTATDVIEMDAASNNGVGDVRNLKDEITFTPAILKYRVYIIDEVHMMSGPAFNALLKTLEEPPSYVVFILATTEFNKLPTTIVSRCQRFDFRRMTSDVIIERLNKISSVEGIDLGEDGARLIARASRGGMRDAVSLLELCAGSRTHIDAGLVASTVGTGDRGSVYRLIEAIASADYNTVYKVIQDIVMGSGDISVFWQDIIDSYRDIMVVKNADRAKAYLDLTDLEYDTLKVLSEKFSMAKLSYHASVLEVAMADMQRAVNSKRSIAEIALTKMCEPKLAATPEALTLRIEELEKQISMLKLGISVPESNRQPAKTPAPQKAESAETKKSENTDTSVSAEPYERWQTLKERIAEIKKALTGKLSRSIAYKCSETKFNVKIDKFFIDSFKEGTADHTIVRGVIAEAEGKSKDDIELVIEALPSADQNNITGEFDSLLNI